MRGVANLVQLVYADGFGGIRWQHVFTLGIHRGHAVGYASALAPDRSTAFAAFAIRLAAIGKTCGFLTALLGAHIGIAGDSSKVGV